MLEREIKLLLDENAIRSVAVAGSPSTAYTILINGRTVKSARRETRRFAKLDTVAAFLFKLGLNNFSVAMTLESETGVAAQPKSR
mgnify:CR=1 FL=1